MSEDRIRLAQELLQPLKDAGFQIGWTYDGICIRDKKNNSCHHYYHALDNKVAEPMSDN